MNFSEEIELMEDVVLPSSIKKEMFMDENNFSLFDHVQILPGVIPDPTKQTNFSVPIISATCRVARNPMFFIWNNYLIMTCLVFISLSTFAIEPKDVSEYEKLAISHQTIFPEPSHILISP